MRTLPTGIVTFLFTDIEGSTRLWEADAASMARAVEAHEVAARDIIDQFQGHLLLERGEGDSLFAVFASPSSAVQAALALQLRFLEPVGDLTLRIRMGLHAGEAQARGTTYFGRSVNRAARIRSVAKGGQIILSSTVREIAESGLPEEIVLRDCGRHRLRDLLRPEQLFEVVHPQLPKTIGPLLSLEMHPHNLPVQLTSFVGRQEPLRDLSTMVREHRLVTVLGTGGCGKTRLSMQIGAEVLDSFVDGVWLVELAPIRDEAELMAEILRVLQTDLRGPETRKALLILDNCEHLREESARCARTLIEEVSDLHILSTSREALGLRGERIYPLRSMPIPPVDTPPDGLDEFEASALFLERAQEKDPNLELSQAEANSVGEIVRLLDGIPLAIEQAASQIGFLTPHLILERLDQWMDQPMEFVDNPDPRHRTLESTIDWSFHLLTSEEQALFLRFAVFTGGWDLAAAEEVCSDESLPRTNILRLMQKLVAKSLVTIEAEGSARRFRLLEPIRQYAAKRLPEETDVLFEQHHNFFVRRAKDLDAKISSPDQASALDAMDADIANIRSALDYGMRHHPRAALDFANDLRRFWMLRGYAAEGRTRLEAALKTAENGSPLQAQTLNAIGSFAWIQSDAIAAERAFRAALALSGDEGASSVRTGILHNLGLCLVEQNEWAEAETVFRACLAELENMELHESAAQARLSLANLLIETDRAAESLAVLRQSMPFLSESGNAVLLALTAARASLAAYLVEDPSAKGLALDAVRAYRKLTSKPIAGAVLFSAGLILVREGAHADGAFVLAAAEEYHRQSKLTLSATQTRLLKEQWNELRMQLGNDFERTRVRGARASVEIALGRAEEALASRVATA